MIAFDPTDLDRMRSLMDNNASTNKVILTGDTHGQFDRIMEFCKKRSVDDVSTFVILGDAGLNYYGGSRDRKKKSVLAKIPVTFFCIHGNHEMRPSEQLGYEIREYRGGKVWVEPEFPNILFAIDGEVYDFFGRSCIVIGGAYSVDKNYRLAMGYQWFSDEQPSPEIKAKVERVLSERNWKIDIVFSHTSPLKYEPVEVFLPFVDQSTVDKSTEEWLDEIENKLDYDRWYCGHYHTRKEVDKIKFMFDDYDVIHVDNTLFGLNENGERVCTAIYPSKIVTLTYQDNGWIRKNIYYRDGSSEEIYER